MNPLHHIVKDIMAEEVRRSHCDRKQMSHKCVGVVKIAPEGLSLDCDICGATTEMLAGIQYISDSARAIARILGVDFDTLCPKKKRELLLEILALSRG